MFELSKCSSFCVAIFSCGVSNEPTTQENSTRNQIVWLHTDLGKVGSKNGRRTSSATPALWSKCKHASQAIKAKMWCLRLFAFAAWKWKLWSSVAFTTTRAHVMCVKRWLLRRIKCLRAPANTHMTSDQTLKLNYLFVSIDEMCRVQHLNR